MRRLIITLSALAWSSGACAQGLGFDVGQLEILAAQAAEKLGGRFSMAADKDQCGKGVRCNWDLPGGVVAWADTVDAGDAVVSLGVGMNTKKRGYAATVSPRVFREACEAFVLAAKPALPVDRVRKAVAGATDLFRKKEAQEVRESGLVLTGEKHVPNARLYPGEAYYRCVVELAD